MAFSGAAEGEWHHIDLVLRGDSGVDVRCQEKNGRSGYHYDGERAVFHGCYLN